MVKKTVSGGLDQSNERQEILIGSAAVL